MAIKCNYKFPCYLSEIFAESPRTLSEDTKLLRVDMIREIAMLSHRYSDELMNNEILIDIEDGEIINMNILQLTIKIQVNWSIGNKQIKLGEMTADNWKTMRA